MVQKRIGGRGCPKCGSHDTEGFRSSRDGTAGATWCHSCDHRWVPCSRHCRGYTLDVAAKAGPAILGCRLCGVPDRVARKWPETYRAMAKLLDGEKLTSVTKV